jgi:hypothetical protein
MTNAKGDKEQGRRAKGQARGKKARARGQGKHKPGIIESWEDFDELAMHEYLAAVEQDFAEQLTEFEKALRSEN